MVDDIQAFSRVWVQLAGKRGKELDTVLGCGGHTMAPGRVRPPPGRTSTSIPQHGPMARTTGTEEDWREFFDDGRLVTLATENVEIALLVSLAGDR